LPVDDNRAYQLVLLKHRNDGSSAGTAEFNELLYARVLSDAGLIAPQIGDVDNLFSVGGAVERDSRIIL
jgi:hypothetical protein